MMNLGLNNGAQKRRRLLGVACGTFAPFQHSALSLTTHTAHGRLWNKRLLMNENTIYYKTSSVVGRPPTHATSFLKESSAALFCSPACWRLRCVKGSVNRGVRLYAVRAEFDIVGVWGLQIRTPLADWNLTQYVGSMVHNRGPANVEGERQREKWYIHTRGGAGGVLNCHLHIAAGSANCE